MGKSKRRPKRAQCGVGLPFELSQSSADGCQTVRRLQQMQDMWRKLEFVWLAWRPCRGDTKDRMIYVLKAAFVNALHDLNLLLDEEFGVKVTSVEQRQIECTRPGKLDEENGLLLLFFLSLHVVLSEAAILFQRRLLTGICGINKYRSPSHRLAGKTARVEGGTLLQYRALRLAFHHLRQVPKQIASALGADVSERLVLELLTGWGLSRSPFKGRPRMQSAVEPNNWELTFMAALACKLGERQKKDPFIGEDSIFARTIQELEREALDAERGRHVVALDDAASLEALEQMEAQKSAQMDLEQLRRFAGLENDKLLDLVASGFSGPEIAQKLGLTEGAVRAAKCRALKKLRAVANKFPESA